MFEKLTYKPFGRRAILIKWDAKISEDILKDIISYKTKIQLFLKEKLEDCIVGYHSLTLIFKDFIDYSYEKKIIQQLYTDKSVANTSKNYLWKIPVCYDVQFGIDLEDLSKELKLSIDKVVKLHSEKIYTVFFIGFLPGFLYLGGLDEKLHFPRKSNPRLQVAKGSVAIGGGQTGVYPQKSAGGWNIIGNTPISFFNLEKTTPCFAKSGDNIQFVPVSIEVYKDIEIQVKKGSYQLKKKELND